MKKTAFFSDCRTFRYSLTQIWDESKPLCAFIGLNPSTADENKDDPTIRRCIAFAQKWGYGGLVMLNLFALRSTDPYALYTAKDLDGNNMKYLVEICRQCAVIVCAWGNHGDHLHRGKGVACILKNERLKPMCLGITKSGQPKHPLYLRADSKLVEY